RAHLDLACAADKLPEQIRHARLIEAAEPPRPESEQMDSERRNRTLLREVGGPVIREGGRQLGGEVSDEGQARVDGRAAFENVLHAYKKRTAHAVVEAVEDGGGGFRLGEAAPERESGIGIAHAGPLEAECEKDGARRSDFHL